MPVCLWHAFFITDCAQGADANCYATGGIVAIGIGLSLLKPRLINRNTINIKPIEVTSTYQNLSFIGLKELKEALYVSHAYFNMYDSFIFS